MPESNLPLSKVTLNVAEKIERSGKNSPGMLKYMPTMIKAKDINNNPRNSPKQQGEVARNNDEKNEKKPEKKKTQLNFKAGYMIRNRWEVIKRVGSGGFGEVYLVLDKKTDEKLAAKMEPVSQSKQVLKMEVAVLKKLQSHSKHVCKYIDCGRNTSCNYMIMSLLGQSLADLRRANKSNSFSLSTSLRLTREMLLAIRDMHSAGYLHRDIKPSNFAIGQNSPRKIYMFDFGLARVYLIEGKVREPRSVAGFRGTVRYASLTAHRSQEMGRGDDLWSLFYIFLEFMGFQLPWKRTKVREDVGKIKETTDHYELLRQCEKAYKLPHKGFDPFLDHLNTLKYYKKPDYDLLDKTIQNLVKTIGAKLEDPYDWEVTSNENSQRNSPTVVEKVDQKKVKEKKIAKDPHKRIKEKPRNKSKAVSKAPTDYGEREKTRVENSGKTLSDAEDLDDNALDDKEVLDIIIDQCDQKNIPSSQRKPKITSSVNFYQSKPANKSVNFAAQKQTLTDYKIRLDSPRADSKSSRNSKDSEELLARGHVQELARKMEQLNTGNSFQRIKTSTLPHSSSTGALDYQSNMFDRGGSIPKRYSDASLASNSRSASKGPSKPRPTPPRAQRSAHSNIAGRVRRFNQFNSTGMSSTTVETPK